jgi:hypothetical protein
MTEKTVKLLAADGSPLEDASLASEFSSTDKIGPFRVGQTAFFYRDGLKKYAIPFADIDQAFTRIEPVPTHCCCGTLNFEIYRLVIVSQGREIADIRTEDDKWVDKVQALLKERIPDLKLGFTKPQ